MEYTLSTFVVFSPISSYLLILRNKEVLSDCILQTAPVAREDSLFHVDPRLSSGTLWGESRVQEDKRNQKVKKNKSPTIGNTKNWAEQKQVDKHWDPNTQSKEVWRLPLNSTFNNQGHPRKWIDISCNRKSKWTWNIGKMFNLTSK